MAVPTAELPLLGEPPPPPQPPPPPPPSPPPEEAEPQQLNHSLQRLETFLRFLGFFHDSVLSFSLSSLCFLVVGTAAPAAVIFLFYCSSATTCGGYSVKTFELEILICQVAVAGFSLFCVSRNLRKYGLRDFVFVDKCRAYADQFQSEYVREIDNFFRLLVIWVLPCLILKIAREIARVVFVSTNSLGPSLMSVVILLVTWVYSATMYLSGSALFSLVCNLQVIHFENYRKLLERDLGISVYIEEHARLTYHLSKISHRFRMFLILEFLVVTASQCVALLETTGNHDTINFIYGADFAISSIVQVVGIIICLHAAAKISHRAQGLASFASKWHAIATCNSNETSLGASDNGRHFDAANLVVPVINYSESDLESGDYALPPTSMEIASNMSSYHRRQAFVMYLQSNPGGVTIFGWTVDRALISTIFAIELSVVTFVLGKTLSFSTRDTRRS